MFYTRILFLVLCSFGCGTALFAAEKKQPGKPANTSEDRPPPLFGYTQNTADDGVPILTVPFCSGNRHHLFVGALTGRDLLFRIRGGRLSRGHFLPYAEGRPGVPFFLCMDGQFPDPRWASIINERTAVVLLSKETALGQTTRASKRPAPPELGYVIAGKDGAGPTLVRLGIVEAKEPLPAEDVPGAVETPERREKYTVKPLATRVPLRGLTLRTVRGEAVDLETLAKSAAEKPIGVAVLPHGMDGIDPFWKPVFAPSGIVVTGLPAPPDKR